MLIVCLVAFAGSTLTLFSGFGLGTVLLPAMALLFPPAEAVAATAIVHLLNNLFKGGLVVRGADWTIVARFGFPALVGSVAGALVLTFLGKAGPLFTLALLDRTLEPTAAAVVIGLLLILFAVLELMPWFQRLAFPSHWIPLGGVITGFVGGLSGQQGALRTAFLLKSGMDAQHFIATGVMIAILIDLARLPTYALQLSQVGMIAQQDTLQMLAAATISAFAGAWIGAKYMRKVTIGFVRLIVALMMILIGLALASGLLSA
jgi:uncharacterized membrane protein YfcA